MVEYKVYMVSKYQKITINGGFLTDALPIYSK